MLNFLKKFIGSKSDSDIKLIMPIVLKIHEAYKNITILTNDELRAYTQTLRQRISDNIQAEESEIKEMKDRIENELDMPIETKMNLYHRVDELEKIVKAKTKTILDEILPEAFAIVKETAKRFTENETIEVEATEKDRNFSLTKDFVTIQGDKAIYNTTWLAGGNLQKWKMIHYDVQLIGGIVLHQGKISEMATGEGKTLVATLPVFLNALTGKGVHLVTVNDYLARRDSEWMGPLYQFHGLEVDCIDNNEPHSEGRKAAYMADITFGTNNEFGFDYLRDNMSRTPDELVQRPHNYAIVDEVDSVLIDDARTPLIISGPTPKGDQHEFFALKPKIEKLVATQKNLQNMLLNDAKRKIKEGNTEEGGLALLRAYRGLPKNKTLIKFLSEQGMKAQLQKTENIYLAENSKRMPEVDAELYFVIDEKNNSVELTDKGVDLITDATEDQGFFIMPDVGSEIALIEKSSLSDNDKIAKKDELLRDFSVKSDRIHTINQLLKAYCLFEPDVEYVIIEGKIKIVDEQTGRIMEGRRFSDGLHQALEAKENVTVEAATQTYATITLQNYFRMYNKLAGMTGTAETEAGELWDIYKLDVVVIPTNIPATRKDMQDLVYKSKREKYNAVIEEIAKLVEAQRPVLVGTTSVEVSELLSRMLKIRGIRHNVLNAKLHKKEADIVREAGQPGTVTIATNMAGRGTDIKLDEGVKLAGGLAIIGTERHESRRVDRQLRGRAGRQGDPGTSQFYVSLDDDLMRLFGSDRIARLMDRMGIEDGEVIQHSMISKSIERAQTKIEQNNFGIRKRLLEYDDVMNSQREVIYTKRIHALYGDRLSLDINNMLDDVCMNIIEQHQALRDFENFKLDCIRILSLESPFTEQEFFSLSVDKLADKLYETASRFYERKKETISEQAFPIVKHVYETEAKLYENIVVPFTDGLHTLQVIAHLKKSYETKGRELFNSFERNITLGIIDDSWKEHLREMDDLKQSVQNATYEQKDPLLIYKFESFQLFEQMIGKINRDIISFLFKASLPVHSEEEIHESKGPKPTDHSQLKTGRNEIAASNPEHQERKIQPVKAEMKIGRNDPCPCGSNKKYKNCHGIEA